MNLFGLKGTRARTYSILLLGLLVCSALAASPVILSATASVAGNTGGPVTMATVGGGNDPHFDDGGCNMYGPAGDVQHVIYIQFDNVHFTRDNPNVPSDLEQIPSLLNFMEQNGVLMDNHYTPLISHTSNRR